MKIESLDQHAIIADIKRVASEIGSVPTREQYRERGVIGEKKIRTVFGSFTVALQAAGMVSKNVQKKPKITNEDIFGRDVREVINEYSKIEKVQRKQGLQGVNKDILVIGDCHFPFVDVNTLSYVYAFAEEMRPSRIVQVGDLYDMFSQGRFPRTHNIYTPKQEMDLGREMSVEMWEKLKKLSPGAECYQILGNHDARPLKRILEAYPEGEMFFSIDRFFQFEGVHTIMDTRQELILDGIQFIHGYKTKLGDHRDFALLNTVCGHSHRGGVSVRNHLDRVLWELNAGYIGDPNSKALSYTPQKITTWTPGFGWINKWGPMFIGA